MVGRMRICAPLLITVFGVIAFFWTDRAFGWHCECHSGTCYKPCPWEFPDQGSTTDPLVELRPQHQRATAEVLRQLREYQMPYPGTTVANGKIHRILSEIANGLPTGNPGSLHALATLLDSQTDHLERYRLAYEEGIHELDRVFQERTDQEKKNTKLAQEIASEFEPELYSLESMERDLADEKRLWAQVDEARQNLRRIVGVIDDGDHDVMIVVKRVLESLHQPVPPAVGAMLSRTDTARSSRRMALESRFVPNPPTKSVRAAISGATVWITHPPPLPDELSPKSPHPHVSAAFATAATINQQLQKFASANQWLIAAVQQFVWRDYPDERDKLLAARERFEKLRAQSAMVGQIPEMQKSIEQARKAIEAYRSGTDKARQDVIFNGVRAALWKLYDETTHRALGPLPGQDALDRFKNVQDDVITLAKNLTEALPAAVKVVARGNSKEIEDFKGNLEQSVCGTLHGMHLKLLPLGERFAGAFPSKPGLWCGDDTL